MLSFPLYVDSLPAPTIAALELIAEQRRANRPGKVQRFLAICRRFAYEAGFAWAGGLALGGGGGAIGGRPLREVGGLVCGVCRALDLSAAALAEGEPVPERASALMARPSVPAWLYRWLSERRWHQWGRRNGVEARLRDRPYEL